MLIRTRIFEPLGMTCAVSLPQDALLYCGGPGIYSTLFAHPGKGFAVAVLTNGEHGRSSVDDIVSTALEGVCDAVVTSTVYEDDLVRPAIRPNASYVGVNEDTAARFRVTEMSGQWMLSAQDVFSYYDSCSIKESTAHPLEHIGDDKFLWRAPPELGGRTRSLGPTVCLS